MNKNVIKNELLANALKELITSYRLIDTRVYFNGKAYHWNSFGEMSVLEDIQPSKYFEFANDETVSMTFEGDLYEIMNGYSNPHVLKEFNKVFHKFDCYYEFGHAWNLTVYYN